MPRTFTSPALLVAMLFALGLLVAPVSWPGLAGRDAAAATASPVVADIQRDLAALGYNPGPADGLIGARTRAAIRRYQAERGLRVDGRATSAIQRHLAAAVASGGTLPDAPVVEVDARDDPGTVIDATALRPAPDFSSPEQRRLPAGSSVRVLAMRGDWVRVRTASDARGWVHASNVRLDEEQPKQASAGAGFLRRITGRVRGRQDPSAQAPVTIGIRGLTAADVRGARPDPLALRRLDDYAVSEAVARAHAAELGLVSVNVAYGNGAGSGSGLTVTPPDADSGPIGASDR